MLRNSRHCSLTGLQFSLRQQLSQSCAILCLSILKVTLQKEDTDTIKIQSQNNTAEAVPQSSILTVAVCQWIWQLLTTLEVGIKCVTWRHRQWTLVRITLGDQLVFDALFLLALFQLVKARAQKYVRFHLLWVEPFMTLNRHQQAEIIPSHQRWFRTPLVYACKKRYRSLVPVR